MTRMLSIFSSLQSTHIPMIAGVSSHNMNRYGSPSGSMHGSKVITRSPSLECMYSFTSKAKSLEYDITSIDSILPS